MSYFKHTNTIWVISMLTLIILCSVSDATRYFLCAVFRLHCFYHFLKFFLNILPKQRFFFSPKNKQKSCIFPIEFLRMKKKINTRKTFVDDNFFEKAFL